MKQETKDKFGIICFFMSVIAFLGLLIHIALNPIERPEPTTTYIVFDEEDYYDFEEEVEEFFEGDEENDVIHIVTVTKYNPTVDQCDSDPLITADGSFIDTVKLKNREIKWIAISRDLRSVFQYGDTVVLSGTGSNDGEYIVRDTMNPKWKSRVDILSPVGDSKGMWEDAFLYKK